MFLVEQHCPRSRGTACAPTRARLTKRQSITLASQWFRNKHGFQVRPFGARDLSSGLWFGGIKTSISFCPLNWVVWGCKVEDSRNHPKNHENGAIYRTQLRHTIVTIPLEHSQLTGADILPLLRQLWVWCGSHTTGRTSNNTESHPKKIFVYWCCFNFFLRTSDLCSFIPWK